MLGGRGGKDEAVRGKFYGVCGVWGDVVRYQPLALITLDSFPPLQCSCYPHLHLPAVHASPPGAISQSKFYPTDETALPPPPRLQISADRDWSVISFPGSRCSGGGGGGGAPALQTSPVCYPIYPSSLFSSRWLLMRLRSNLLSATRPPTKHCRRKKKLWCFFHLLRFVGGDLTCVRGHYAVAHDPRRERRRISVFNQTTTADR